MCQPIDNELTVKFSNEKLAEEVVETRIDFVSFLQLAWRGVVLVFARPVISRK